LAPLGQSSRRYPARRFSASTRPFHDVDDDPKPTASEKKKKPKNNTTAVLQCFVTFAGAFCWSFSVHFFCGLSAITPVRIAGNNSNNNNNNFNERKKKCRPFVHRPEKSIQQVRGRVPLFFFEFSFFSFFCKKTPEGLFSSSASSSSSSSGGPPPPSPSLLLLLLHLLLSHYFGASEGLQKKKKEPLIRLIERCHKNRSAIEKLSKKK